MIGLNGEIVKAADELAAFIEASVAIRNGSHRQELHEARLSTRNKYAKVNVGRINLGEIYSDFE
ncbi:MAG: hypothetical protein HZA06_06120 [Nitrospirae bacterium]|nr:hypothetical protein [Nitrospirota bacterium]